MTASVACSFFFDAEPLGEAGMPALDACALCNKPLARDSDIFMYRGDTPFCSEECRDEQIQLDAVYARQTARRLQRYTRPEHRRAGNTKSPGRCLSRADRPEPEAALVAEKKSFVSINEV